MDLKMVTRHRVFGRPAHGSGISRFRADILLLSFVGLLSACVPGSQSGSSQPETADDTSLRIKLDAPLNYELDTLSNGTAAYIDSDYTLTDIPSTYDNLCFVRTASNDKFYSDPAFLTFSVNKPVTVYVAYAAKKNNGIPTWLESWSEAGERIAVTPKDLSWSGPLQLFSREFPPGSISLGGNELGGFMYAALIEDPESSTLSACSLPSDATLTYTWEPNLDYVTGYRVYHGNSAGSVNTLISEVYVTDWNFDPARPSVEYDADAQLGLYAGQTSCFSVSAFDDEGESPKSSPICTTL